MLWGPSFCYEGGKLGGEVRVQSVKPTQTPLAERPRRVCVRKPDKLAVSGPPRVQSLPVK